MKVGRFIRGFLASLAGVLIVAGVCAGSTWLYLHPRIDRVNGRRFAAWFDQYLAKTQKRRVDTVVNWGFLLPFKSNMLNV